MFIKPLISVLSVTLLLGSNLALADNTRMCNQTQQGNCGRFCQSHQGMKSCIIDLTTRSGTCGCTDGTTHTKS